MQYLSLFLLALQKYSNFYVFFLYGKSLFHQKTDSLQKVFAVFPGKKAHPPMKILSIDRVHIECPDSPAVLVESIRFEAIKEAAYYLKILLVIVSRHIVSH